MDKDKGAGGLGAGIADNQSDRNVYKQCRF